MLNEIVLRIADLAAKLFPLDCMGPEFMRRAMLGLLLIAPLAALSGVQVVNSRMSFFSDAIGHSAFAGVALGLICSLPVEFTMPVLALVIGLFIMYLRRGSRQLHRGVGQVRVHHGGGGRNAFCLWWDIRIACRFAADRA